MDTPTKKENELAYFFFVLGLIASAWAAWVGEKDHGWLSGPAAWLWELLGRPSVQFVPTYDMVLVLWAIATVCFIWTRSDETMIAFFALGMAAYMGHHHGLATVFFVVAAVIMVWKAIRSDMAAGLWKRGETPGADKRAP